jgi:Big-like domain-containing protein
MQRQSHCRFAGLCVLAALLLNGCGDATHQVSAYTVSGTVSGLAAGAQVTLQINGNAPIAVSANGAFTFPTTLTQNGSYSVTVVTQPSGQTCVVTAGKGSGVSANVSGIGVGCGPPMPVSMVVAPNQIPLSVGTVRPLSALGTFADGAIKDVTNAVVWSSSNEAVASVDRSGVVTANESGEATVSATTGGISAIAKLTVTSLGSYVYAIANNAPGGNPNLPADVPVIAEYVMSSEGAISPLTPFLVTMPNNSIYSITRAPGTPYVYVPTYDGSLLQSSIGSSGQLNLGSNPSQLWTPGLSTSPLLMPGLLTFHPSGHYAYISAIDGYFGNPSTFSQYSVAADGHLSRIPPDLETTPYAINWMVMHPSGLYLYALGTLPNQPGSQVKQFYIVPFSIDANGALAQHPAVQVSAEQGYLGQSPDCQRLMVAPSGRFAYVVCYIQTIYGKTAIYQYQIAADGSITPAQPAAADTPQGLEPVVIDPRGMYAYGRGSVFAFDGGSLRQIATWSAPSLTNYVIDGSGRYLFAAVGPQLLVYSIGPDGIPVQTSAAAGQPPLGIYSIATTQ